MTDFAKSKVSSGSTTFLLAVIFEEIFIYMLNSNPGAAH
jgi:hypothetical protein